MLFMNEFEIENACIKYAAHPVLAEATRFLRDFMEEVNNHSDGWPHWALPCKAARQLMQLILNPEKATDAAVALALRPIKAFYTRHGHQAGMKFPASPKPAAPAACGKPRAAEQQSLPLF